MKRIILSAFMGFALSLLSSAQPASSTTVEQYSFSDERGGTYSVTQTCTFEVQVITPPSCLAPAFVKQPAPIREYEMASTNQISFECPFVIQFLTATEAVPLEELPFRWRQAQGQCGYRYVTEECFATTKEAASLLSKVRAYYPDAFIKRE